MLGNDIVDLKKSALESNWQRKGFLDKIFTKEEQQEIWSAPNPEIMVWLFWSMKEAVYKIINRESSQRFYSPTKFNCKLIENEDTVTFEDKIFYTESEVTENLIHTIATINSENLADITTSYLINTKDYLSDFNSKAAHYTLEKDANGIPNLVHKTNRKRHAASVSHHGDYLAIVYSKKILS